MVPCSKTFRQVTTILSSRVKQPQLMLSSRCTADAVAAVTSATSPAAARALLRVQKPSTRQRPTTHATHGKVTATRTVGSGANS